MIRLIDWEDRLHAYLAEREGVCFTWGATDCALFAAGAAEAMTGVDLAADFRGRYSTAGGATRALKRLGADTLEATIATMLPERAPPLARRGDLVMADGSLGICIGAEALFVGEADGAPGLVRVPRTAWTHCWSVG